MTTSRIFRRWDDMEDVTEPGAYQIANLGIVDVKAKDIEQAFVLQDCRFTIALTQVSGSAEKVKRYRIVEFLLGDP